MPAEERHMTQRTLTRIGLISICIIAVISGLNCSNNKQSESTHECFQKPKSALIEKPISYEGDLTGTSIDLVTYDAFLPPEGAFERFTAETGITVNLLQSADTGTMVSQAVLTSGDPIADVMFGIDNTFLCRGLSNNIFHPYQASTLSNLSVTFFWTPIIGLLQLIMVTYA